jgi:hypothetical protein
MTDTTIDRKTFTSCYLFSEGQAGIDRACEIVKSNLISAGYDPEDQESVGIVCTTYKSREVGIISAIVLPYGENP